VVAALGAGNALRGFLHGIAPGDPLTLAASTAAVLVAAGAATLPPLLRTLRLDVGSVLRVD
jgi:hypothetical protein